MSQDDSMATGDAMAPTDAVEPLSPELSAERLSELADDRPDLWDEISRHPNIYPELLEWIEEGREDQERASSGTGAEADDAAADEADERTVVNARRRPETSVSTGANERGEIADELPPLPPAPSIAVAMPPAPPAPSSASAPPPPGPSMPPPPVADSRFTSSPPLPPLPDQAPTAATAVLPGVPPQPMSPSLAAASVPPAPFFPPPAAPSAAVPPQPSTPRAFDDTPKGRRKGTVIGLVVAGALVLGAGGYTGFAWWKELWPFADASDTQEAARKERVDEQDSAEKVDRAAESAIPNEITATCPDGTELNAWMLTGEGGWALVCGIDAEEPAFVAYQSADSNKTAYSAGYRDPTTADAKAAVDWDEARSRYSVDLDRGGVLTLDLETGKMTIGGGGTNAVQERIDSFLAMPLGGREQTIRVVEAEDEPASSSGDRAEEQVRAVNALLADSISARTVIKSKLQTDACYVAASDLRDIRDRRETLMLQTDELEVDLLPEGDRLLADLQEAADANYQVAVLRVDREAAGNCTPSSSETSYAVASDAAKERIAARWNRAVVPEFTSATPVVADTL